MSLRKPKPPQIKVPDTSGCVLVVNRDDHSDILVGPALYNDASNQVIARRADIVDSTFMHRRYSIPTVVTAMIVSVAIMFMAPLYRAYDFSALAEAIAVFLFCMCIYELTLGRRHDPLTINASELSEYNVEILDVKKLHGVSFDAAYLSFFINDEAMRESFRQQWKYDAWDYNLWSDLSEQYLEDRPENI